MRRLFSALLIVTLFVVLSLNSTKLFSGDIGLFIALIALTYGIVTAFTLSNSWERFSKIRDAVTQEMNSLVTMHIYAQQLSDGAAAKELKDNIILYCDEVPQVDWHHYWKSEKTHKQFRKLFEILAKAKLKTAKDIELFNEVSEELRSASHARDTQMLLAQTRLSSMHWALNIFLAGTLLLAAATVAVPNAIFSAVAVGVLAVAVTSVMFLIHELDSMMFAEREIACEPYANVIRIVSDGQINPDQDQWYQDRSAIQAPAMPRL